MVIMMAELKVVFQSRCQWCNRATGFLIPQRNANLLATQTAKRDSGDNPPAMGGQLVSLREKATCAKRVCDPID